MGELKENFWKSAIEEYKKRLSSMCKLEVIELAESAHTDTNVKLASECKLLTKTLDNINGKKYLLDIQGCPIDSIKFAKLLNSQHQTSFIIGSSNGVLPKLFDKVDSRLSFGNITMPHQLFRVVLVEQIYRGFMINCNSAYHK